MITNMMTKAYVSLRASLAHDDEQGVEAIEWIAMAAAVLLLLAAVGAGFQGSGNDLGTTIVQSITAVVGKLIK